MAGLLVLWALLLGASGVGGGPVTSQSGVGGGPVTAQSGVGGGPVTITVRR